LEQAAGRLRLLCASLLHKSHPRLTRPPVNLETDELLGGVVAGLLTALRTVRPPTVRQFFALANQPMHWQLNDLACRLDEQPAAAAPPEAGVLVGSQGLTHAEAAALVGVSEKTVQRRLNRARLLLAEQLADLRPVTSSEPTPPPGDTPPP
jgi:RNA polymerase sigma-70 factor (ECF subfamily)